MVFAGMFSALNKTIINSTNNNNNNNNYTPFATNLDWNNYGTLYGENNGDRFGGQMQLSASGDIIIINSERENSGRGGIRIFKKESNTWVEKIEEFGTSSNDRAEKIALSSDGNTFGFGSRLNDVYGSNAGEVKIYEINWSNNSSYIQKGQTLYGSSGNDQFGFGISLSGNGNRLAVGIPGYNSGVARIIIYDYDIVNDNWDINEIIDNTYTSIWTNFGWQISLSSDGNTCLVGSTNNKAVVFKYLNSSWSNNAYVLTSFNNGNNNMGRGVALSYDGNRAIVSENTYSSGTGLTRVWEYDSTNQSWSVIGGNNGIILGISSNTYFGSAVAISGNGNIIAIVGGGNGGLLQVYQYNNNISSKWEPLGWTMNDSVKGVTNGNGNNFGQSVSLNENGDIVCAGTLAYDSFRGEVVIFNYN